jgi:hypothetical protein
MAIYTVQAPGADIAALSKAKFVKDGFSTPAFVFAQLWLLYHRQWLAFAIWIVIEAAVLYLIVPHVSFAAVAAVDLVGRLWLGFEGQRLRLRRQPGLEDIVEARDLDEAERIFFRRHVDDARTGPVQA